MDTVTDPLLVGDLDSVPLKVALAEVVVDSVMLGCRRLRVGDGARE